MTPQSPSVPQHIQIELARRELKSLQGQQSIAEFGIQALSNVAAELNTANETHEGTERAMFAALVALVALRLLELQNSHAAIEPRIAELENALRVADSGIVRPVRN